MIQSTLEVCMYVCIETRTNSYAYTMRWVNMLIATRRNTFKY